MAKAPSQPLPYLPPLKPRIAQAIPLAALLTFLALGASFLLHIGLAKLRPPTPHAPPTPRTFQIPAVTRDGVRVVFSVRAFADPAPQQRAAMQTCAATYTVAELSHKKASLPLPAESNE